MSLRRGLRNFLLLAWACALSWFYLGSLVNFHQHQIWKKQLIPQLVASLKQKEKTKAGQKTFLYAGNSDDLASSASALPAVACPDVIPSTCAVCCLLCESRPFIAAAEPAGEGGGLRAPPLS